jgi:ABC-type transporter Mla subunit MlaD
MEAAMPRKKYDELKAGIFVIAAVALLLGVVLWLGASDMFTATYGQAVFCTDAETGSLGLIEDGAVMFGDLKIGKIASVSTDKDRKRIFYKVKFLQPGYTVYKNGKAMVNAGFIGGSILVITSRGTDTEPLADNEGNAVKIAPGMMANMTKMSESLVKQFDPKDKNSMLSKINSMVDTLLPAAKDIAAMTSGLRPELDPKEKDSIAANLKTTSANLAKTTGTVDAYVQKDLGQLIVKIREISTSVLKTANNMDVSSEKIKQILVANSGSIDETMDNMVAVSANLKAASTEIRRNPWRLFYKPDDKKVRSTNLYDAARAFDEGAQQLNVVVTKLKALRQLEEDDPQASREVARIKTQLMESFKNFKKVEDALWKEVEK